MASEFDLISLLRGVDPENPLSEDEWMSIFIAAKRQSLLGVTFALVENLSADLRPTRKIMLSWMAMQGRIIALNKLVDKRASEVTEIVGGMGFRSCVLKGQGVARLYPRPELRQPGDIDLLVEGDRNDVLEKLGTKYKVGYRYYHHTDVTIFDDIEVEIHHIPTWLCNPFLDKRLQMFFKSSREDIFNSGQRNGFNYPKVEFDAIYSLVHIYRHVFNEGVGLRQVMDYNYILRAIPRESRLPIAELLVKLGLGRFAASITYVCHEVFNLEEEYQIVEPDVKCGRFLLEEIMLAGNFGKYDKRNAIRSRNIFIRFFKSTGRSLRFIKYFPREAPWVPIWMAWHFILRKLGLGN